MNNPAADSSMTRGNAPLWLTLLAKAGYGSRGFIYVVIGSLALLKAFGGGGQTGGSKDAMGEMLRAPGGIVVLWLIAIGLVGYSAWRFCQSVLDADDHGNDTKGLTIRAGLLISAITHLILAGYAGYIAYQQTESSGSSESTKTTIVGWIMGWPGGRIIVAFIGACIIGAGVAHAIKARKEKYEKHFVIERSTMEKLEPICKYGLYARSVVLAIIGVMFFYTAFTQDPENAGGLKEVLDKLSQQAFGTFLLAAMAVGLFAFGLYSIFESIFRKIDKPD